MNHAITIGGLLGTVGLMAGLGAIGFGLLWMFAEGMSDAPSDNGKGGCITMAAGAVLAAFCIASLIFGFGK